MLNLKDVEIKIIPGEISLAEVFGNHFLENFKDESFVIEVLSFEGDICTAQDKIY